MSILIVEDNPANMKLAVFLLTGAGYVVVTATDAESALMIAREQHPDLILMDIQLPGMDGLEAIGLLRRDARTSAIPVIALTALAMNGDEARILAAGADSYLAKPVRYGDLLSAVGAILPPPAPPPAP